MKLKLKTVAQLYNIQHNEKPVKPVLFTTKACKINIESSRNYVSQEILRTYRPKKFGTINDAIHLKIVQRN